jgi:hypothetical protein
MKPSGASNCSLVTIRRRLLHRPLKVSVSLLGTTKMCSTPGSTKESILVHRSRASSKSFRYEGVMMANDSRKRFGPLTSVVDRLNDSTAGHAGGSWSTNRSYSIGPLRRTGCRPRRSAFAGQPCRQ